MLKHLDDGLTPAGRRVARRARIGFLILTVAMVFALGQLHRTTKHLCAESHRRYDTIVAVAIAATTPSPIAKQRVNSAQYAELVAYDHDLRVRLLASAGDPPSC